MFSHVTIGTQDLARAIAFYDVVLAPLGIERVPSKYPNWAAWHVPARPQNSGWADPTMGYQRVGATAP